MATWRCGQNSEHSLGKGTTRLLNSEGFMCCLGQFTPQLNPEVKEDQIKYMFMPASVSMYIPLLTEKKESTFGTPYIDNTNFAGEAVTINDSEEMPVEEKVAKLRELFGQHGYEIEVINVPSHLNIKNNELV